jgi:hypothetical protein
VTRWQGGKVRGKDDKLGEVKRMERWHGGKVAG